MLETIGQPREAVKEYAPKIYVFKINPEKIKEVIGKGGEVIDKIIEQCDNIKIDFEDDGTCFLTHSKQEIIVQLPKGKQGLCHVSNLGQKFTDGLDKHFKVGDAIHVVISQIGQDGKIAVKRKLG